MLSRRGLLPLSHRQNRGTITSHDSLLNQLIQQAPTALNYLRSIRIYIDRHPDSNWRDILAALRPITPQLWIRLPETERSRFLRHVQPYWDVHRHRVAPTTFATFEDALKNKKIMPIAGRVTSIEDKSNGARITIDLRGKHQISTIDVDTVINCTGPNSNPKLINEVLINTLIEDDLISIDPHSIGINVSDDLSVIDSKGHASDWLSYVGPMLKATFWEATAVPELRVHAGNVAKKISTLFSAGLPLEYSQKQ
jgi:uncharacterized NAD(P)/FAD-binding protein YdhS